MPSLQSKPCTKILAHYAQVQPSPPSKFADGQGHDTRVIGLNAGLAEVFRKGLFSILLWWLAAHGGRSKVIAGPLDGPNCRHSTSAVQSQSL